MDLDRAGRRCCLGNEPFSFILTSCLSALQQKNDKIDLESSNNTACNNTTTQPATTQKCKVRLAEFCVEESNIPRCGFSVESLVTSFQQTATTSSYFLFNWDFFCGHSLMDSVVILIEISLNFFYQKLA